jgi:DNA-binding CsgD family transcriptional regulator
METSVMEHLSDDGPQMSAMARLGAAPLRRAVRAAQELGELCELAEYPARAASILRQLIPCDIARYSAVDLRSQSATVVTDPAEGVLGGGETDLAAFGREDPVISITIASPRRTLGRPGEVISLTLSRAGREFSEAEGVLLQCLRPHFSASLQRLHELALLRATGTGSEPEPRHWVLLASREGTVAWITPAASERLNLAAGERLSPPLRLWTAAERARRPGNGAIAGATLTSGGLRLRVRLVRDAYPELDALHLTPLMGLPGPGTLRSLRLTRRQAEVLALALEGRASAQIAHALTLSPRTVEKHFEAIYARLGVANRTQAITGALQALDAAQPATRV